MALVLMVISISIELVRHVDLHLHGTFHHVDLHLHVHVHHPSCDENSKNKNLLLHIIASK